MSDELLICLSALGVIYLGGHIAFRDLWHRERVYFPEPERYRSPPSDSGVFPARHDAPTQPQTRVTREQTETTRRVRTGRAA